MEEFPQLSKKSPQPPFVRGASIDDTHNLRSSRRSTVYGLWSAVFLCFFTLTPFSVHASNISPIEHKAQISGWTTYTENNSYLGLRYLPEVSYSQPINNKTIDALVGFDTYVQYPVSADTSEDTDAEFDLYRCWMRYTSKQGEVRVGLQQINFGPAKILRSLMWFDTLVPEDPLSLTKGVWAVLSKYYFLNNSNIWVWALLGDDTSKGWGSVKTDENQGEFGGRFQFPVPKGELALSFHSTAITSYDWSMLKQESFPDGHEFRYACDGSFDLGIGLWFESVFSEIKTSEKSLWQEFFTIGTDYTLPIGLHVLYEHFVYARGDSIDNTKRQIMVSAMSFNYPWGILDSFRFIGYYHWDENKPYASISWQRKYDNWQVDVIGFSIEGTSLQSMQGKGLQVLLTYNY